MKRSVFTSVCCAGDIAVNAAETAVRTDDVFSVVTDGQDGDLLSGMAIRTVKRSGFITVNL